MLNNDPHIAIQPMKSKCASKKQYESSGTIDYFRNDSTRKLILSRTFCAKNVFPTNFWRGSFEFLFLDCIPSPCCRI